MLSVLNLAHLIPLALYNKNNSKVLIACQAIEGKYEISDSATIQACFKLSQFRIHHPAPRQRADKGIL